MYIYTHYVYMYICIVPFNCRYICIYKYIHLSICLFIYNIYIYVCIHACWRAQVHMTYIFLTHFTDDMGVMHLIFHFAHDMGVCVFWVCPTTPMTSAGTIWIINDNYIHE